MAAAQTGAGLAIPPPTACSFPFPSMAPRSCPIGHCRRKCDPSRASGGSVAGSPVGGRGDRAGLPRFAGSGDWQAAAVAAALSVGTCPRSRPAPDSRNCRCRTSPRNPTHGKTTAVTPLLWPSHPARVWTTALLRGTLAMLWSCPLTGAAIKKTPIVAAIGGFPFHLRPGLAGASANRRLQCVPTPSRSSSCHTLSALSRESEILAGTGGTEGYGWESGRLQIAAAPGAAKRGAGRNGISRGLGKRPPLGRPSAADGARTGPSVRRPFRTVARGTPHSWDSPLRPPPLFCRLLLLSGRAPTSSP